MPSWISVAVLAAATLVAASAACNPTSITFWDGSTCSSTFDDSQTFNVGTCYSNTFTFSNNQNVYSSGQAFCGSSSSFVMYSNSDCTGNTMTINMNGVCDCEGVPSSLGSVSISGGTTYGYMSAGSVWMPRPAAAAAAAGAAAAGAAAAAVAASCASSQWLQFFAQSAGSCSGTDTASYAVGWCHGPGGNGLDWGAINVTYDGAPWATNYVSGEFYANFTDVGSSEWRIYTSDDCTGSYKSITGWGCSDCITQSDMVIGISIGGTTVSYDWIAGSSSSSIGEERRPRHQTKARPFATARRASPGAKLGELDLRGKK